MEGRKVLKIKYITIIIISILTLNCLALPQPKIYLPFEGTDGYYDNLDPVWLNRAVDYPGTMWFPERGRTYGIEPSHPAPWIAEGEGVNGGDCLDQTLASAMGGSLGTVYYGKLANTADSWFGNSPVEDVFDNAVSFTITGWFNTKNPSVSIGDFTTAPRLLHKYSQVTIQGKTGGGLSLLLRTGTTTKTIHSNNVFGAKNEWVFFAVTFDGSNTDSAAKDVKFYVGSEISATAVAGEGSSAAFGPLTNVANQGMYLVIGNYGLGTTHGNSAFKGYIDDLRVYSSLTDNTGVLSKADIESIRRKDIGQGDPIYLAGDINEDYAVNIKDLDILSSSWLGCTDPNNPQCDIVIPQPQVYFAFDNTDGAPYDIDDPAFVNHGSAGNGEKPTYIMPTTPASISISSDAVRGGSLDLTANPMCSVSSMLVYGNSNPTGTDTAIQDALDDAKSFTLCCWWKHNNVEAILPGGTLDNGAYLVHRMDQLSFWARSRTDSGFFGEMAFTPNDEDENSGHMIFSPLVYPDVDEWVFFAFTFDGTLSQSDPAVGRIKWYRGTFEQPVFMHTEVQFPLDTLFAAANGSPLIIGNRYTDSSAAASFSALIDEMRIYVNKTNGSAALTPEQLETIRLRDSMAHNFKKADLNKNRKVNFSDFAIFAETWLNANSPI